MLKKGLQHMSTSEYQVSKVTEIKNRFDSLQPISVDKCIVISEFNVGKTIPFVVMKQFSETMS